MRTIDIQTWPRRKQFELFSTWAYPQFNMCANVDLTSFRPAVKQRGVSFTVAIIYVIGRAANAVPEFRTRIRQGKVVEHEIVHPAITVLTDDDQFAFCQFEYSADFAEFAPKAAEMIAYTREHPTLDMPFRDDLLYMTAIPWLSFTSFMHPLILHPADSVPRFAYGKYFAEAERLKMPLSIQGHHAMMDGLHVARCFEDVQKLLDHPADILGPLQAE